MPPKCFSTVLLQLKALRRYAVLPSWLQLTDTFPPPVGLGERSNKAHAACTEVLSSERDSLGSHFIQVVPELFFS